MSLISTTRSSSLALSSVPPFPGALAGGVGDDEGEAGASAARIQDEGALGVRRGLRTQPEAFLAVLNAANVAGRGTGSAGTSSVRLACPAADLSNGITQQSPSMSVMATPPPAAIPPERRIYANRTLNMRSIRAIGYDMDYTLIHYRVEEWERGAYEQARGNLAERGWPVEDLRFDPTTVIRGLTLDLELGNLVKPTRNGSWSPARKW